ncbi:MAG: hypothetical protein RL662_1621 [Bacteroidota bacterium]|jgi:Fur family ferric uptake transcriptional regulator
MNAEYILKQHNLKNTGCRKHIINELIKSEAALSESNIKDVLPDLFDRVTFYRSLKTLEENNIIHKVVLHDATVKYALNKDLLTQNEHAHFHCVTCHDVLCIDAAISATAVDLPNGFLLSSTQVLLEGTCPNCKIDD